MARPRFGMDVHGCKKALFTGQKNSILWLCPKKFPVSLFFSHFHENCLFRTGSHSVKSATPYERHCYHSKKNLDASKTKSLWGLRLSWVTQKRNGWLELWIILDYLYIQVIHYNAYQFGNSQNLKESIMNSSFFFFFCPEVYNKPWLNT